MADSEPENHGTDNNKTKNSIYERQTNEKSEK